MTAFKRVIATLALADGMTSGQAWATEVRHSPPGLSGYDPVASFADAEPMRSSEFHVTVYAGVTYAFANEKHKKMFTANPQRYLSAYGGYCAYGVAIGKKVVADPDVWKILDDKLYLNLDKNIQNKWEEDTPGDIKKADTNWSDIKDKTLSDLSVDREETRLPHFSPNLTPNSNAAGFYQRRCQYGPDPVY